jgi:hypothetical protein
MDDRPRIKAVLVTQRGSIMRTTVPTHPIPRTLNVDGWPFKIHMETFMLTGKAVYSGYYPSRYDDRYDE